MEFRESVQVYAEEPLTRQIVLSLLTDYKRPNDKINELIKNGDLTAIKNGLYVPGPRLKITGPEPFLIANHLRGPSYVSMESALSYWGLIPERVYETISVTIKNSKTYGTPVGRFTYFHTPPPYYSFGIKSVSLTARQVALIAGPEKALCDKIIMTPGILLRSTKQAQEFLIDDLRIDEDALQRLDWKLIASWASSAHKASSIEMLSKTLSQL